MRNQTALALQSATIDYLRPILMLLVVMVHANCEYYSSDIKLLMQEGHLPIYTLVSKYLHDFFLVIAVPAFYFFSGYLFFFSVENFSVKTVFSKLQSRIRSLLFPYFFWNLFYLLVFFVAEKLSILLQLKPWAQVSAFSLSDWLWCFWDYSRVSPSSGHYPFNSSLWFIRDLAVVILLSPLVHYILRRLKIFFVLLLLLLYISNSWVSVVGLNSNALTFFTFGGYFSLSGVPFIGFFGRYSKWFLALYVVLLLLMFFSMGQSWVYYFRGLSIVVGIAAWVNVVSWLLQQGKIRSIEILQRSNFFIFAYHIFVISLISRGLLGFFGQKTELVALSIYFLSPLLTIALGVWLYWVLSRRFPRLISLISGGRG